VGGVAVPPAAAQDEESLPPLSEELIEERLDPRMRRVAVQGEEIAEAEAAYEAGLFALAEARRRIEAIDRRLVDAYRDRAGLAEDLDEGRIRLARTTVDLAGTEDVLRETALQSYMAGGRPADRILAEVEPAEATRAATAGQLASSSTDLLLARRSRLIEEQAARRVEVTDAERRLGSLGRQILADELALRAARVDGYRLALELPFLEEAYRQARLTATVRGTDLPLLVLDAYVRAADAIGRERAACGLSWWHLAGIGRVESDHGRFGGRSLLSDGRSESPIVGVPLDGRVVLGNGEVVALISDTDGGAFDGDPVYDRAVGPMQFIPSTWQRWGADGNGDGFTDPNNVYDATLAAGRYLCAVSGDLRSEEGTRRALQGYNRSESYGQRVYELQLGYAAFRLPR